MTDVSVISKPSGQTKSFARPSAHSANCEIAEQASGNVHVDGQRQTGGGEAGLVARRLTQHPFGDGADFARLLRQSYELIRPDHAAGRVAPADQRLDRIDLVGTGAQLRLIGEIDVAVAQRAAQIAHQRQPLGWIAELVDPEHGQPSARMFSLVGGKFGALDQQAGAAFRTFRGGEADDDADVEDVPADIELPSRLARRARSQPVASSTLSAAKPMPIVALPRRPTWAPRTARRVRSPSSRIRFDASG